MILLDISSTTVAGQVVDNGLGQTKGRAGNQAGRVGLSGVQFNPQQKENVRDMGWGLRNGGSDPGAAVQRANFGDFHVTILRALLHDFPQDFLQGPVLTNFPRVNGERTLPMRE
jgi:hypothetical protein